MTGVETILRRLFEGKTRRWSIIILIGGLSLALGLPAVDEYCALRQREDELSTQLAQAEQQVNRAGDLRRRATSLSEQLHAVESQALNRGDGQAYRQALVNQIRKSGCQLRKLNMENPALRDWAEGDNPLAKARRPTGRREKENASGYQLRSQTISLSVTGSLNQAKSFLTQLQSPGKLMHVRQLSIRPTGADRNNVVMELEFTLFGLQKAGGAASKAEPVSA